VIPHAAWLACEGERLRYAFPLTMGSIVVDAGGYTGEWAGRIASAALCRVEVFEPIEQYADQARRLLAGSKCRVHTAGLGADDRETEMTLAGDASSAWDHDSEKPTVIARMVAAGPMFESLGLDIVDLLKINIEGGEYELLPHLIETGYIRKVRFLLIQWHSCVPYFEHRRDAITKDLEKTHRVLWQFPWVWEAWERKAA
jgi:FkbM family methyltransferase